MARTRGQRQQRQREEDDPGDDDASGGDDAGDSGFTADQRKEMTALINAAVGGRLKRQLPALIRDAVAGPIDEMRSLVRGGGRRQAADDDDLDDDDNASDDEPPAQRRAARGRQPGRTEPPARAARGDDKDIAVLRKQFDKLQEERKTEREARRAEVRDSSLREHLQELGVDKHRMRGAIAVVRESAKYDEKNDEWYWQASDGQDLDLSAGVTSWAGTDEGKAYLAPPAGGQGSGSARGARGGAGTRMGTGGAARSGATGAVADPKQAKQQAKQQAQTKLVEAIDSLGGGAVPLG